MSEAALGAPLENPDRQMCLKASHGRMYPPFERVRREDSRPCGRSSKSREEVPRRGWASAPAVAKTVGKAQQSPRSGKMQGTGQRSPFIGCTEDALLRQQTTSSCFQKDAVAGHQEM